MNLIRVPLANPDELLTAFGANALIRVQSGSSASGPWSDLVSAPTQVMVATTYSYLFTDAPGTVATWYQFRTENSGGTVLGAYQALGQQGASTLMAKLEDARQRLKIAGMATVDWILHSSLVSASAFLENRTGRHFYRTPNDGTTAQFLFDGWDESDGGRVCEQGRCLLVPRGIVSLTTLEVATFTGDAYHTIPTTDWFLRPNAQERDPGWPATELWMTNIPSSANSAPAFYPGFGTVRLTGVLGWPAVPWELNDMCLRLVVNGYRAFSAGGADQFQTGMDGSRNWERMLSGSDLHTLGKYVVKEVAII
jgi:hypothetical protein